MYVQPPSNQTSKQQCHHDSKPKTAHHDKPNMNNTNTRPPPRRGPSGAWTRLRTPPIDLLESYGLPSKGETRLSDQKLQETYFERIVSRYMKFCASCGDGESLSAAFENLDLSNPSSSSSISKNETSNGDAGLELPMLLMAMRKLREALVSSNRTDAFAQRAYIFIIHAAILCRHLESYHAALLYLLQKIHPQTPLSHPETQEFAGYLVLDLACRQGELGEAFRIRKAYELRDRKIDAVLRALVTDDWVRFWRCKRAVDGYQRMLMSWAEDGVRVHALKCLGRAYMVADRGFVERCADRSWSQLVAVDKVGWVLEENGNVTIRRPKQK